MQTQPRRGICNSEFGQPPPKKIGSEAANALAAIIRALRAIPLRVRMSINCFLPQGRTGVPLVMRLLPESAT
jgi:hypothetical protein